MNVEVWREQIRIAREAYKPDIIRCLLIAEAPPDKRIDSFIIPKSILGIMGVLYPKKAFTIEEKRPKDMKKELLHRFKEDGFYLEDLLSVPKRISNDEE